MKFGKPESLFFKIIKSQKIIEIESFKIEAKNMKALKLLILIELFTVAITQPEDSRFKRHNQACGVTENLTDTRILDGSDFLRGTWPWLVALQLQKSETIRKFRCAGTLITRTKVVTGWFFNLKKFFFRAL